MKITFILCALFLSTSLYAAETNESDEFHSLLSMLLHVNQDKYTYTDSQGKKQNDSLKLFKESEAIYIKYIKPDEPGGKFSEKRLKVLMLFSFYAEKNNSAAFLEYLAADLVPVYNKDRNTFLSSLNSLSYMVPAVCGRLNAFFGHEGKNKNKKKTFVEENKKLFLLKLDKDNAEACLKEF